MISSHAGLEGGEDERVAMAINLEDGATAITNVQIACGVEGNTRGHAQTLSDQSGRTTWSHTIHGSVEATGSVESTFAVKGKAAGIGQSTAKGLCGKVGVEFEKANRGLLAACTAQSDVDATIGIKGGIADGMKVFGNLDSDFKGAWDLNGRMAVEFNLHGSGDGGFGNAGDEHTRAGNHHGSGNAGAADDRQLRCCRQTRSKDPHFRSGKSGHGIKAINARCLRHDAEAAAAYLA